MLNRYHWSHSAYRYYLGIILVNDFIPVRELAQLTGYKLRSIYVQSSTRRGPLVPILSKMGAKLGCWRADYDAWRTSQRKIPDTVR